MPELPDRPNLDQLRRQARELLRGAADGEPAALIRIRAVSERVSLSAAQLALAREYGCASWPALHAEVQRRLAELPAPGEGAGQAGTRWSFGGAAAIQTAAGTLYPGALVASPGRCCPGRIAGPRPAAPGPARPAAAPDEQQRGKRGRSRRPRMALAETVIAAVALTDDLGTTYVLRVREIRAAPAARAGSTSRCPCALRWNRFPLVIAAGWNCAASTDPRPGWCRPLARMRASAAWRRCRRVPPRGNCRIWPCT